MAETEPIDLSYIEADQPRVHVRDLTRTERVQLWKGRGTVWVRFKNPREFASDDMYVDSLADMDLPVRYIDTEIDVALVRFPDIAAALRERDEYDPVSSRFAHEAAAFENPAMALVVPVERFDVLELEANGVKPNDIKQ